MYCNEVMKCSFYISMPDAVTVINKDDTKVLDKTSDML